MRKPVKPGSFRILDKGGTWTLTGRKHNGDKVRIPLLSREEASSIADKLFPRIGVIPNTPLVAPTDYRAQLDKEEADFWGPPEVATERNANLNASIGLGAPIVSAPPPTTTAEEVEKKAKRAKNAKSLMELTGVGWAAGSVWVGRAACERFEKDAPNPNPRQVNDLADVTKETLSEWFGDRDIKPWMMMFLLTLGIPVSMLLQARPRKPTKEVSGEQKPESLRSLP
jgi:hypothetical protein